MNILNSKNNISHFVFFLGLITVAAYYRLAGLGLWGFTSADEYYMAKSVGHILKFGLPKFETGGYYTRGILYQYISAGFILLGLKDVVALRFVAVLANFAAIPAVYLISNKLGGKKVAFTVLFLFLFSSWEVEYARFSRYYTLFQTFFLWHLFFIYKVIIEKENRFFIWALFLSILSIFVYEGGIFLVAINFLPFITDFNQLKKTNLFYAFIVLITTVVFIKTDFRQMGVNNQLPDNLTLPSPLHKGMIYLPKVLISTVKKFNILWFGFLTVVIASIIVFKKYIYHRKKLQSSISIIFFFLLLLLNQIAFAFFSLILLYLLHWIDVKELKRNLFLITLFGIVALLFFTFFMYYDNNWISFFADARSFSIKNLFWVLIDYPDIYQQVLLPWIKPLPFLSIIFFGTIIFYFVKVLINDFKKESFTEGKKYYFLITILFLLVMGVALIVTPYQVGRYTFFIHPLVIILFCYSAYGIIKSMIPIKIYSIIFFTFIFFTVIVSRDYSATHLLNIKTQKEHFKEGYPKYQATMYYLREDYKTVAEYVNEHINKKDIVILTVAPAEYYLKHLDYYYRNYKDMEFTIRSREKGTKELWTNAKLIYDENKLLDMIKNFNGKNNLWLITYSPQRFYAKGLKIKIYNMYKNKIVYRNLNNTIVVYKF